MCGIVGVIGPGAAEKDLSPSLVALSLRGPDRQAQLHVGNALLGHTRLSIIDTSSGGDQPMQDPTGRYTLIFNGEIYNYRSIADILRAEGVKLKTNSDTEALLILLIRSGKDALAYLNGFFAFAFYDKEEDYTLIARDKIGIKPLFYAQQGDDVIFSSEMKGILPLVEERQLDASALHFYFRLNYIPAPHSIHQGIKQLAQGHAIEIRGNKVESAPYYELKSNLDASRTQESLRDLLSGAVRSRLVSDVPLGSFLSGGVDSSIIAALACKEKPGLKTFSIGFADNEYFDETAYAERVAEHIGSDHLTISLHSDEMLGYVDKVLDSLEEPFADSSAIAVYALSEHTRKHVTVALSGDGADELFGGYNKHQAHLLAIEPDFKVKLASAIGSLLGKGSHSTGLQNRVRKINRFVEGKNLSPAERYWAWASWTSKDEVDQLLCIPKDERSYNETVQRYAPADNSMEEVLLADTRLVLVDDMLRKVDRMSMANSLEVRVPFLDRDVVEYAHSIPAAARMGKGKGKYILRDHFSDLLPADIFTRTKKGFEVPLESWFLGPLRGRLNVALTDGQLAAMNCFSTGALEGMQAKLSAKQIGSDVHLLWAILVLHAYVNKHPLI